MWSVSSLLVLAAASLGAVESTLGPLVMSLCGVKRDTGNVNGDDEKAKNRSCQTFITVLLWVGFSTLLVLAASSLPMMVAPSQAYKATVLPGPTFQDHQLGRKIPLDCHTIEDKFDSKTGGFLLVSSCVANLAECEPSDLFCRQQSNRTYWHLQWRPTCELKGCDPDRNYENRYTGYTETSGN